MKFVVDENVSFGLVEAKKDHNIFRARQGGKITPLKDGQVVLSPVMQDAAGRLLRHEWNVVDPEGIFLRTRQKSIE